MRIACVVGARPNFIKIAPLISELKRRAIDYFLVHTGQHYDAVMNDRFFEDLDIPHPDVCLGVGSGTHGVQTGRALMGIEKQLMKYQPDLVVVVGDVNSTLAGALAAAKLNIPVAHVEAGYRSFDRSMPEEVNRVLVDHMAGFLFAPTQDAVENLTREGIDPSKIFYVGNIMTETLLRNMEKIKRRKKYAEFGLKPKEYAVATIHRPENTDNNRTLTAILESFSEAPLPVILPLHPRTEKQIGRYDLGSRPNGSLLATEAFSYIDMLSMLMNARLVLTDSGGVQEEACLLQVPCLTIRNNTERVVTVNVGANRLVSAEKKQILRAIDEKLDMESEWAVPANWDNQVAKRILEVIEANLRPRRKAVGV